MTLIRPYRESDLAFIKRIHSASGLPPECFPPLQNPNFVVRIIAEKEGRPVQAGFVKLTGEAFVLVDHEHATPQEREATLNDLVAHGLKGAADYGLDDVSAWLPPTLEKSFGARLEALGWIRSPWRNWTAILR